MWSTPGSPTAAVPDAGPRRRLLALSLAVGLLVGACGPAPAATGFGSSASGVQVDKPTPAGILRLPLISSGGRQVTLGTIHADVVAVSDVTTLGRETSPVNTTAFVRAARAVQDAGMGDRVSFLSITIDPERDTPTRLATYRRLWVDAPADWMLLTGSPRVIHALWNYFGLYHRRMPVPAGARPAVDWVNRDPLNYTVAHADQVDFLNRARRNRFVLRGPARVEQADQVPALLDDFLDHKGRHGLSDPGLNTWSSRQVLNVLGWLTARRIPSQQATEGR